MADDARYRFRGNVKPTAEVKRPVRAYRNADTTDANGTKSTSATIDIFDVIDSWGGYWGISAGEVDQALAALGEDVTTLYVRVNSPGGEATEGIAIANLLRAHAATIHVTNYGLAASAASVIAIAGHTLTMAPGSLLMIHKAWNYARGNADDLRDEAGILDKFDQSLAGMYALKGGGDTDWLALMGAETWFTPEDAVAAGLADKVGIETGPPPANPDDQVEPMPDVDGDTPFDRAARVFDLSVFEHAPAAFAAHTPAARAPETPAASADGSTTTQEGSAAVAFTDEQLTTMRQTLGVADDADEATILAALDEALAEHAEPPAAPPATPSVPEGHVVIDADALEELRIAARAGAEARAQQLRQDRDDAINAAIAGGHVAPARRAHWQAKWDADPDGVRASLAQLCEGEPIFPVAPTGYAGSDDTDGEGTQPFTEDEADALAALAGLPKGAIR